MVLSRRSIGQQESLKQCHQDTVLPNKTTNNTSTKITSRFLLLFCVALVFFFDHRFYLPTNRQANLAIWNDSVLSKIASERLHSATTTTSTTSTTTNSTTTTNSSSPTKRDGFIVLGMHRSGTSMLTGLLYTAAGYTFGGGKITHGIPNPKGYFERMDALGQNEGWFKSQEIAWNQNILEFDWEQALKDKRSGGVHFEEGDSFLRFISDEKNVPWLQKDPRTCITLKAWIKLMEKEPAILFTYRHPLEVALSLHKREWYKLRDKKTDNPLSVTWCLKLWIAYNMRAIQNSRGLCVVRTSNRIILANPIQELERISSELTNKCGVATPPHAISQKEVSTFVDVNLQHHNDSILEYKPVLKSFNDGSCVAYTFESDQEEGSPEYTMELETYLKAMTIFCDLESGKAYEDDYVWPDITFQKPYEY